MAPTAAPAVAMLVQMGVKEERMLDYLRGDERRGEQKRKGGRDVVGVLKRKVELNI